MVKGGFCMEICFPKLIAAVVAADAESMVSIYHMPNLGRQMIRSPLTLGKPFQLLAIAALAALGACSSIVGEPNEVIAECPETGVLAAAESLERYRTEGASDLTDLLVKAKVGDVRNVCSILKDERKLLMDMRLQVAAEKGPATAPGQPVRISYFVAVVGGGGNVLQREEFQLEADFPDSARQASFPEELFLTIPIVGGTAVRDYSVYIGLQLSRAELERALKQR